MRRSKFNSMGSGRVLRCQRTMFVRDDDIVGRRGCRLAWRVRSNNMMYIRSAACLYDTILYDVAVGRYILSVYIIIS